jgi:hypothetical protein
MKNKALPLFLALTLFAGAFLFPMKVYAQTDTALPIMTAELLDGTINAIKKSGDSGIQAICIDEHCLDALVSGATGIEQKICIGNGERITLYTPDTTGRCRHSVFVLIDDLSDQEPLSQYPNNPVPNADKSPSNPVSATSSPAPAVPNPASASGPTAQNQLNLTAQNAPSGQQSGNSQGTTSSSIPNGANAFTPGGGGTVQDNATEQDGKEFFIVTTAAGNVYYLIIDRQRGTENVYFLSPVTEADLLGLTDGMPRSMPQPEPQPPETPQEPKQPEPPQTEQTKQPEQNNMGTIVIILLAAAAAGGAGYYLKIVKPRKQATQFDEDYEDDFDGDHSDQEYFFSEDSEEYFGESDEDK